MSAASVCDWVCLTLLPGLGPGTVRKLIGHFGSPQNVLQATVKELSPLPGLRTGQLDGFRNLDVYRDKAKQCIDRVKTLGGSVLVLDDPAYPELLREIPDPPAVLYTIGDRELLYSNSVAIVGSRSATSYGRRIAFSFAEELGRHGVIVVSGLALGIDSESHAGAIHGGGSTIAVLGCGIDVVYPRQNRSLYDQISSAGLLVSEYPPGTRPDSFRFPARNRIIAGLSRGIVVVEAARKSGSLITAQLGLDFGREIFAVPGQVDSYKSEGAHWLLRQGAQLAVSPADILAELQVLMGAGTESSASGNEKSLSGLEPDAVALLRQLEPYPMSRDEIGCRAGLSPARLSELFLFLELDGHIEILPGDMVRRVTMEFA